MIISISGTPGSGKSTLGKALAKQLNMKRYYIGGIRRDMAKKRGMTLAEYNKYGETHPETDMEVDKDFQEELGRTQDNFIIEGRTSWHFLPNSIKIFLDTDLKEAATRIYGSIRIGNRSRNEGDNLNSREAVYESLLKRIESDRKRYKKYYDIDVYDKSHYDFVLDTTHLSPKKTTAKILEYLETKGIKAIDE